MWFMVYSRQQYLIPEVISRQKYYMKVVRLFIDYGAVDM
jgi:hypothetical protein